MTTSEPEGDTADSVLVDTAGGIATITLNRPHRLNAFTAEMRVRYLECLAAADRDPGVKVIVLTGAGRAFCAGADFAQLDRLDEAGMRHAHAAQGVPSDLAMRLRKPLIAAVNGPVAGLGFAPLLMADLRFATPEARFTTAFARLGLPAEDGIAWLLPRIVGTARALDLLLSARMVDGEEALRIGLVQWVVPAAELLDRVREYAGALVEGSSSHSMTVMREQVHGGWEQTWPEAFGRSQELLYESLRRPEFAELVARRASLHRRPSGS